MVQPNPLLHALSKCLDTFRAEFKACRRNFSEEAVHDLRVASRRLLAVLDMARTFAPSPELQKTRRAFKRFLDSLDELRDVQVQLADGAELLQELPQAEPLLQRLKRQEKKLLRQAEGELTRSLLAKLSKRIERLYESLEAGLPARGFRKRLVAAVDQAFERAQQAYQQLDPSDAASIHRLRIAFKKFRYVVEIARPALRGHPEELMKAMHDYQSKMGEVQDVEVLLQMVNDFAERYPEHDMLPVRAALEQHRSARITEFMNVRETLFTFWRSQPDQPFPWEPPQPPLQENADETVHHPTRHRRAGRGDRRRSRQPTPAYPEGAQEDGSHRPRTAGAGKAARPDPHQPLPASHPDGGDPPPNL